MSSKSIYIILYEHLHYNNLNFWQGFSVFSELEMVGHGICVLLQVMIIDCKLPYPSGTATAVLINGFHTPKGDNIAKYAFIL